MIIAIDGPAASGKGTLARRIARELGYRHLDTGKLYRAVGMAVLRQGGDPSNPDVRRKSSTLSFIPTNKYNVFRSATGGDPLSGVPLTWARLVGNTLTVHSLVVDDDGTYNMLTYDRTLSGTGMALVFTRVRDGEPVRKVEGKLIKYGD